LRSRPGQLSVTPEFVERMCHFNRWMKQHATETEPAMTVLDTTHAPIAESVEQTVRWIRSLISSGGDQPARQGL
jgi:hypothetical protein